MRIKLSLPLLFGLLIGSSSTTLSAVFEFGKNPNTTVVIIDEVETDNWGIGGESVTRRRAAGK